MDSGAHGSVGYGVAVFLSEQAVAAWNQEMTIYLSRLESSLGPKEAKRLLDEQRRWEKSRPRQEEETTRKYEKEAGTLYMVYWAADNAAIPRKRALVLGCRLENLSDAVDSD
jgi:hypothetical protein